MAIVSAPYYKLLERGTTEPIEAILQDKSEAETSAALSRWCQYKIREAGYVQVAGAVMFASVVGCQSWPSVEGCHWSGPACWNASIVLSICAILTGAQQTLVLSSESNAALTTAQLQRVKTSLAGRGRTRSVREACPLVVFSWQVPLMFLCYAILCFLAGLCSIVYSPLALKLRWNADAKSAVFFTVVSAVCAASWITASLVVFRLRIPGHLLTEPGQ